MTASAPRFHGLDALRAGALLLGIVLHALMPFVPGMGWMITDTSSAAWAMPTISVIHLFRMVLFLLLAGFFGRLVTTRRGMPRFLRERTVRIALPVFAFWPIAVLPLAIVTALWAAAHGIVTAPPPPEPGVPVILQLLTPGQLWFLWVLYQCCLLLAAARWAARRLAPVPATRVLDVATALLTGPWAVAILAAPYAWTVVTQGTTYAGVDEPRTLLPDLVGLVTYLSAFTAGWLIHRRDDGLDDIARRRRAHLVVAVAGSIGVLVLTGQLGPAVPWSMVTTAERHTVTAIVSAVTAWSWVYGLLGACTVHLRAERRWVRYLADASYWMYLLHLPLLVTVGALFTDLPWPATPKLFLTMAVTTAILVLTYDGFVRSTWIGAWLNGHRRPREIFTRREGRRDRARTRTTSPAASVR